MLILNHSYKTSPKNFADTNDWGLLYIYIYSHLDVWCSFYAWLHSCRSSSTRCPIQKKLPISMASPTYSSRDHEKSRYVSDLQFLSVSHHSKPSIKDHHRSDGKSGLNWGTMCDIFVKSCQVPFVDGYIPLIHFWLDIPSTVVYTYIHRYLAMTFPWYDIPITWHISCSWS